MTDPSIPRTDYYVYALFREDGETPFYIGKGWGRRMFYHDKSQARGENPHKDRVIAKVKAITGRIPKAKLADGLTNEQALELERDLIFLLGRVPIGPLTNLTDGGDGGTKHAPESIERMRVSMKVAWADPKRKDERLKSSPFKIDKSSPEGQEFERKRKAGIAAFWANPERSKKSREQRRELMKTSPELLNGRTLAYTPEAIQKRANTQRRKGQKTAPLASAKPESAP